MTSILSAEHFHNEEAAYAFVEKRLWPQGPTCPHCGSVERISKMGGASTRIGTYKCYVCRKPFTVKIGTIFEGSHVKMHIWLQAMHLLCSSKKGFSTTQLQRILGVSMQTAWFLAHRIREAMSGVGSDTDNGPLGGENKVVEADETYVGGKAKNRAFRKPAPKQTVFALVERGGRVRSRHIPDVSAKTLRVCIEAAMDSRTYLMTDEAPAYRAIAGKVASGHGTVNHSADEYVRLGGFLHTNTVESYFSLLKRGITGTYHHVSQAHLHLYLAEFDFRHNNRIALGVDDAARTDQLIRGVRGKRLTYRTTDRQMSV